MSERTVIRYLAGASAAVGAVMASLLAVPGDVVPQAVLIVGAAISAGLAAFVAIISKPEVPEV